MRIEHHGGFRIDNVADNLSDDQRSILLDVVLTWASLDGAVSLFYAALHDLNDIEHADEISDLPAHLKLRKIQLTMRPHAPDLARAAGKLKKQYEAYSKYRDTIAHCHCRGTLKDAPDRIVFLRYRRTEGNQLTVDAIHTDQFEEAHRFGMHLLSVMMDLDNRLRPAINRSIA